VTPGASGPATDDLVIRPFDAVADEVAVLELLQASMGWVPDDLTRAFFRWKHQENAFGRSAAWVAEADGRLAGFRTFLRWEWDIDGVTVPAVRAVDTATHPDFQGRGIFSKLTLHALEAMKAEGVGFVFNTPNDKSRPGYLKMGWRVVARLPLWARPRGVMALPKLAGAAVPAEKMSIATTTGEAAADVFADTGAVARLLGSAAAAHGASTHRTPDFLRWRYGFAPLHYRVALAGQRLEDGLVVYRLRRRGRAVEATVCDLLMPGGAARPQAMLRRVVRASGADYAVRLAGNGPRAGWLPVPGQGPTFVFRHLTQPEPPARWALALGDVELF
jgi:GNAT superfamily N-acetyltransferase